MKSLLLSLIILIGVNLSAQEKEQTDTILYQYRISIKDITTKGSSSIIQEHLTDLFRVKPSYQEVIGAFVFESYQDIKEKDVNNALSNFIITYFRREQVK